MPAAVVVVAVGYSTALVAVHMPPVVVHTRNCSHYTANIHIRVEVELHTVHTEDIAESPDYTPRTVVVRRRRHQVRMLVPRG